MSAGLNRVSLIGNLGEDPDLRFTQSGKQVANFSLATNEAWSRDGEKHEHTEWHRIVVWGAQAEAIAKYLKKGSQCYVEGRLRTRSWEDKDGNKRYTTEINANSVLFLGRAEGGGGGSRRDAPPPAGADDDIPF